MPTSPGTFGQATAFTVRELTGDQRVVKLTGRALPQGQAAFRGKMSASFTHYPGNPVRTVQAFGPDFDPSTFSGMWKDRFIRSTDFEGNSVQPAGGATVNNAQVADVMALANVFNDIKNKGQLLEVTWDERVRQGLLMTWDEKWERREDLHWEMEFEWTSEGLPEMPLGFSVDATQDSIFSDLQNGLNTLQTAVQTQLSIVEDFTAAVNAHVQEVTDAVFAIQQVGINLIDQVTDQVSAAKTTLSALEEVKGSCQDIYDLTQEAPSQALLEVLPNTGQLSQQATELVSGPAGTTSAASPSSIPDQPARAIPTYGQALAAVAYVRGIAKAARDLRNLAMEQTTTLRVRAGQQEIIGVFKARQNMDLREVSTLFYGTPTQWQQIEQFNSLSSSKLDSGTLVFVPKLRTTGSP